MKLCKIGIIIFSLSIVVCFGLLLNQNHVKKHNVPAASAIPANPNDVLSCFFLSSVDTFLTSYYLNNYDASIQIDSQDIQVNQINSFDSGYQIQLIIHPHFADSTDQGYDMIQYQITPLGELIHEAHHHYES